MPDSVSPWHSSSRVKERWPLPQMKMARRRRWASAGSANRPGGGLGPPIDAPPPLQAISVVDSRRHCRSSSGRRVLHCLAATIRQPRRRSRQRQAPVDRRRRRRHLRTRAGNGRARIARESSGGATGDPGCIGSCASADHAAGRLKEELFELEVEHKQGQISQQEYEKTKAALDQTLQRALKRESQKA